MTLRKSKCHFGREDDWMYTAPCREDEQVCSDESSDPKGPFFFFYAIIFKRFFCDFL